MSEIRRIKKEEKIEKDSVHVNIIDGILMFICHKEDQMQRVINKIAIDDNELVGYEEWDEGEDKKWFLYFRVPDPYNFKYNDIIKN